MRRGGILLGLVLIAIGVFLLLRAVEVVPEDIRVWPILVLALGLWGLLVRATGWWGHYGGMAGPLVLIAVGGMFFLRDAGAVDPDISVWPVVLIAVGLGVLLEGMVGRRTRTRPRTGVSVPLEGARSARVGIRHGAGRLRLGGGAGAGLAVEGEVTADVAQEVRREGDRLEVDLRPRGGWRHGPLEWSLALSGEVPLSVELRTGAGEAMVDLSGVTADEVSLETGASKTEVVLPATGRPRVRVKAGAAGVALTVPQGMAARIRARTGMASVEVDAARFPSSGDGWASPDFDAANDRAEIDLEGGAASFTVR